MERRTFLRQSAATVAGTSVLSAAQTSPTAKPLKVGLDLFSVRDQGWTAFQMLNYAAKQ